MDKEYSSTLITLKRLLRVAEDVNLTLDRQMVFDEKVKGYVGGLIEEIEGEGTEPEV